MNRYCFIALALAVLMGISVPLVAQNQKALSRQPTAVLLARADSAFQSGRHALARRIYAHVLKLEPNNARATFRLGQMSPPGSQPALKRFRRYVALEPSDPWGHMALADAYANAGLFHRATRAYVEAVLLDPTATDSWIGLGKILERAGRAEASVEVYERWSRARPQEALAWQTLGSAQQRSGHLRESAYAYKHALALQGDGDTFNRLRNILSSMAPAITPLYSRSWDSDGNVVYQVAVAGNWMSFDRTRLGVRAAMTHADEPGRSATAKEFSLTTSWQLRRFLFLEGKAGVVQTEGSDTTYASRVTPVLDVRTRWRGPANQPAGELRVNVVPLTSTPKLLAQPVVLKELQGLLHVPVFGPVRLRGLGQMGNLKSAAQQNVRLGYSGALTFRMASDFELSAQYRSLAYRHPTRAGYFAPELLRTIELAPYLEYSRLWPFVITLDLGIGVQRATPHGAAPFSWGRAFRLWALAAWNFQPGRQLALEIESYETITPGEALIPDYGWRSNSVALSLRWGLGAKLRASDFGKGARREARM